MSLKIESEVKVESEPCVVAWDEKLYVGSEDGSIKSYNADLSLFASWLAHSVQPFALAALGGFVYSASNDGGIKVWSSQGEKVKEFPPSDADVVSLHIFNKQLFAGDEVGTVSVYENNEAKAKYSVLEEVKDLCYNEPFLFTVRDLYVTVTEIKPEESKTRFITRFTMQGRAPLRIAGSKLLFMARDGNNLQLHTTSIDNEFKLLHEIKVSDMIVTSLTVTGDYAWTGGWDGYIRRWKIADTKLESAGEISVGACINALVAASGGVYAAISGGRIVYLKSI